jgi:FkbM family methyltransferase
MMRWQIASRNRRRGEPELSLLPTLVPRDKCSVDIGAYLGAYTEVLLNTSTNVYVFEPQSFCNNFLRRAYGTSIHLYEHALSDYNGIGYISSEGKSLSQGARVLPSSEASNVDEKVSVRCLDSFGLRNIGFVKIDAEGHELPILKGALATLKREKPLLLVEIEQRHSPRPIQDTFDWLEGLGYRGQFFYQGVLNGLERFSVSSMQTQPLQGNTDTPYINNFIFSMTNLTKQE